MLTQNIKQQLKENKNYLIPLAIYTFLFLFFCSKFSPIYPTNEWADVNIYFNMAKGMLNGMTLYADIFDHKGPLIFFIYAIGALISGSSYIGMFILQILAWIVAIYAAFFTVKLFSSNLNAFLIALILPLSFLVYMYYGGSAEEMILLFEVISLYFFLAYFKKGEVKHKPTYMFVHGILTGMTFLIKFNLMLFWFFPLLYIFIHLLCKKEYKNFLQNCATYLLGFAVILLPVCVYFIYNGALNEAFYVYVELNRKYGTTDKYTYLLLSGISRLYKDFRVEFIWYAILMTGMFVFPVKMLRGKFERLSIILSGIATLAIVFFSLAFHDYYPLPLFVFIIPGLIVIFLWLEKLFTIKDSKKTMTFALIFFLLIGINKQNFFDLGAESLLRMRYPDGPQFVFKDRIMKEENPTLLNLGFEESIALYTTTNITPNIKYFFCPNIFYETFPDIRDSQVKYIENKETMFIVDCNIGHNYDFFLQFESLHQNYTLIDSTVIRADYVIDRFKTFYLYKRND